MRAGSADAARGNLRSFGLGGRARHPARPSDLRRRSCCRRRRPPSRRRWKSPSSMKPASPPPRPIPRPSRSRMIGAAPEAGPIEDAASAPAPAAAPIPPQAAGRRQTDRSRRSASRFASRPGPSPQPGTGERTRRSILDDRNFLKGIGTDRDLAEQPAARADDRRAALQHPRPDRPGAQALPASVPARQMTPRRSRSITGSRLNRDGSLASAAVHPRGELRSESRTL